MDVKVLTPEDASALALVAENPRMPEDLFKRILDSIQDEFARKVARALVRHGGPRARFSRDVRRAADHLDRWVAESRKQYRQAAATAGR